MARSLEQIVKNEKPEVVAQAQALAAEMLLEINLAELRKKNGDHTDGAGKCHGRETTDHCRNGKTRTRHQAFQPEKIR